MGFNCAKLLAMKIAVIGGGAAGMMAAAAIVESGQDHEIFLIEKNASLGQKVIISGGGRCNVTTGFSDLRLIADRYPRGGKFLMSALNAFSPAAVYAWFEAHGVPLKTEADNRVFPQSNNGKDIVAALQNILKPPHAKLLFRHELLSIQRLKTGFELSFKNQEPIRADHVIVTTGGQAYRNTGSTGDGYAFAEALGHTITPLAPSLNSFITKETWPKELAGVSLPMVTLRVKKEEWTGPILFTHRGLTGPAVFALSSKIAFELYSPEQPLGLTLDLEPGLNQAQLEMTFKSELQNNPKKMLKNSLAKWMPKSLAAIFCSLLQIDGEKNNNELSKKNMQRCIETMKRLPLTLIGRAAGDEFVTAGGVDLKEINPRSMESKLVPGLFFAGEILNVDGFTGGYNLQAAWATGRLAGLSASGKIET